MTAHPPIAAAITDARNKPRNMSPPAWVRTASMPRAPPRFESPLASLLSPSGLYCDAVPPDIPVDLAAALAERYELRQVLGRGGMATVYLAYDRKHRRDVALKVLLPGLAAFLGVERFLKEIQVAARLTHPHILALHDSGEAGGFLYYVMPYIEGGSLRQHLAGKRAPGDDQALAIAGPVADALSYAHRMGVLHRDIKPENILFSQGHPIVADFGIAKAISTAGGATLTEEDVLGLDVPVQHAHPVRVGERVGHGPGDRQRLVVAGRSLARQVLAQRAPLDVRHDIIEEAARLTRVVQGEDVGVGEARGHLDLLQEPLDAEEGGQAREQHLERDVAPVLAVVCQVYRGHAAATEHLSQLITLGERSREIGGGCRGHRGPT